MRITSVTAFYNQRFELSTDRRIQNHEKTPLYVWSIPHITIKRIFDQIAQLKLGSDEQSAPYSRLGVHGAFLDFGVGMHGDDPDKATSRARD
jgi:hypothetical protein